MPLNPSPTDPGSFESVALGPAFRGYLDDDDSYSVLVTTLTVTPVNGECDSDCTEVTSCSYDVVVSIGGAAVTEDPNYTGPSLTLTPPVNTAAGAGGTTASPALSSGTYDAVTGIFTYSIDWTWNLTITPTCLISSVDVTFTDESFSIAAGTGSWSKEVASDSKDLTYVFGCAPCDGTKYESTTQSTKKNENAASITSTTAI